LETVSLVDNTDIEEAVFKRDGVEAFDELPDWKGDHDVGEE